MPSYESDLELYQVQVGEQSAFATAQTPTAKLMTVTKLSIDAAIKAERRKYLRGSAAPAFQTVVTEIGGGGQVEEELTYEDLYFLESIFGKATPGGSAAPYTRDYAGMLTSKLAPRILTLVYGAADGAYKLTGGVVPKTVIKGNSHGIWTATHDLFGYDVTGGTLAALNDRTVNPIVGSDTTIYLDTWTGTLGATALTVSQYDFELTIDTKRAPKRHMTIRPDGHSQPAWDVTLKLVLEFDATAKAEIDAILAVTAGAPYQRQVRIKATRDAGANEKLAQWDFAGVSEVAPKLWTDQDGVSTIELMLAGQYQATLANYLKLSTKNGVATLP